MVENTVRFIEVVKKHDIIYNSKNPNYKNCLEKLRAWEQISEEMGITFDAAKRKWKNLRDSYTKYLRSFRVGTKTSKKYQFWAHADHMEFLKPHQGPGRGMSKKDDTDENDSDIGFQVLKKVDITDDDEWTIPPQPPPPPLPAITPTKMHVQPSIIVAKNISNGFVTQIHTTPVDNLNGSQTTPAPIVAKIKAIPTPASSSNVNSQPADETSSPPAKMRKILPNGAQEPFDVELVTRANRDLDATCLFFLSLAKSVRAMPKRYQAMVKMRCMKIVSDAEVEVESNFECDDSGMLLQKCQNGNQAISTSSTKQGDVIESSGTEAIPQPASGQSLPSGSENSEHFLYVMSPSRVESMIEVSTDDEATNGAN